MTVAYNYASEHGFPLPSSLKGKRNGELPDSLLTRLPAPGKGRMELTAARAFVAMQAAFKADTGRELGVTSAADSYRSRANQIGAFMRRYRPVYNPLTCTLAEGRLGPDGKRWFKLRGVAALAGFDKDGNVRSLHGWGIAADLTPVDFDWLSRRAIEFGFKASSASEKWHWFYVRGDDVPKAVLDFEAGLKPAKGKPAPVETPVTPKRPTLRLGSKGDDVKVVQAAIGAFVDGDFGPKTQAAVMQFQRDHGLTVDGIVGPQTWALIS